MLDDRHLAATEPRHLLGVVVGTHHVVAEVGKTHASGQSDVSRANNCEPGHRLRRSVNVRTVSQDTTTIDEPETVDDVPRREPRLRGDRRNAVIVVLLLLGVYWTTMGGHTVSVDGEIYLAGTRSLVRHTTVIHRPADIDGVVAAVVPNTDGDPTTIAPIGTLVLLVPGYVVGKAVSLTFPQAFREEALRLVFLSANPLMTAITGGLLYILCRRLGTQNVTRSCWQ